MSQLNKEFFIPGVKHVCRFCDTPLAKVKNSLLVPLASKAHLTIVTENGIIHRFNCCKQCAKKDFKGNEILQQVWNDDVQMWKNLEIMEGLDQQEAEKRAEILRKEKIILDFVGVELDIKQAEKVFKQAERFAKKIKKGKK